jgi:hypothetical protein
LVALLSLCRLLPAAPTILIAQVGTTVGALALALATLIAGVGNVLILIHCRLLS